MSAQDEGMEILGDMFARFQAGLIRPPNVMGRDGGHYGSPDEVRAMTTVAELRFPISVQALDPLVTGLELAYGKGLTMRGEGDFLIIETPEDPHEDAEELTGIVGNGVHAAREE